MYRRIAELQNGHLTGPKIGTSQHRIHILVSMPISSRVRNPIKAMFSVLDHYNMLKHIKYTFQLVRHMPIVQLMQ